MRPTRRVMGTDMFKYLTLVATLGFTVYGQLIIKVRSEALGATEQTAAQGYLVRMLTDPWVWSGLMGAGLAAVSWMLALRYFSLAFAYPFMALSFALVPLGARLFLNEPLPLAQIGALLLIVVGVTLSALSAGTR